MSVKNCEKLEKSMVALTVEVGAADFEIGRASCRERV